MEHSGTGESTGLDQTAAGKIHTGFTPEDVFVSRDDREVLRRLAAEVAEIASSPRMADTRDLWRRHNMLERTRPVVFCDPENGWNEIITESQIDCQGKLARRWEMDLRKEIFWGTEMGDDKPVEPYFNVSHTVAPDDWGVETVYHQRDPTGSYVWDSPIRDYESDLKKLRHPGVDVNWETTNACVETATQVVGDLLPVRLKGTWWWSLGITYPAVLLRGITNLLYDFTDHPDELKELLSFISKGHLSKLDYLEENDLLRLNNDGTYVGSGGFGFTDELPQADIDDHVRCQDMWGFTESQETVHVSPAMYEEFIFPYEKPIMERFGLNCYGCCEPLHARWRIVKRHHNLRRVSCSQWSDWEQMAENLGDEYIFSMKPSPAALALPVIDKDTIRSELRRALEVTKGCVVEVLMKDNHTLGKRPENAMEWCRIAKEEAERAA